MFILREETLGSAFGWLFVSLAVFLCLICPPFSWLMAPQYLGGPRREHITRVEYDHEYFGAI
ncbi:MAG TPA: hypothetical protein VLU25_16845 [Acidobacteriota bacterium]|nr:hypothetical protein [Acidobacteriota bacterium]